MPDSPGRFCAPPARVVLVASVRRDGEDIARQRKPRHGVACLVELVEHVDQRAGHVLLESQRVNRIEARRPQGREEPEEDAGEQR